MSDHTQQTRSQFINNIESKREDKEELIINPQSPITNPQSPVPNPLTKTHFFAMIKHVFIDVLPLIFSPRFVLIGI
ncbi:hypothetical protein Nos7524_5386 [Nostoc sp. PCC 7524]|uniref:hypothetical protein n=1 Tax=Nostoc sp. (strain ATCC 29411 / PCC 7524) TaxID=28072 RepID=UPI00029ECD1D|nr:hypothetical protein [Nostoc sp. PCC 7524]AFY51104.1 hypothetical protein Nos7524_5386 [Nostoc sp. PCC 7524]